jgi:hypothetical protein
VSVNYDGWQIPDVEEGVEKFIEVIGAVIDEETISFLTCFDMGSKIGMGLNNYIRLMSLTGQCLRPWLCGQSYKGYI